MRTPPRPWLATAGLALLALALSATLVAAQKPRAERPTLAVGETWHRSDGTYTLTRVDGGHYVFASADGVEMQLTADLVPARIVRRGTVELDWQPAPRLGWPLEVGRWGTGEVTVRTAYGVLVTEAYRARATWRVEAYEDITVAGRPVKAFRVSWALVPATITPPTLYAQRAREFTMWYAPAARRFVRSAGTAIGALAFETTRLDPAPAPAPAVASAPAPPPAPPPVAPPATTPAAPAAPPAVARPPADEPLRVEVRYPDDRARVTDAASVVAAVVNGGRGVTRVSVTLNGAEVFQRSEPAPSVVVSAPVTLREGANAIVVSATGADGSVRHEVRTVILERAAAAPAPTPPPAPTGDRWAVVVGIGRYDHRGIPPLRFAVSDAEAIHETLLASGFRPEQVVLLTDKTERKPTYRNLKWALGTFLPRSARREDTVLIFFAGHGAPETDQRGVERDGLAKYLIPIDADADDLYSTALPMDELQTIFARIEAERVIAFVDACYSGAAGGRTFASKRTRAGAVDDLFLERLTRSKGRAIVTASRPAEVSMELPELGHGIFTYFLVRGLRGGADLNRDGIVSLQELYEYVEQQVTRKSRSVGGNQHPMMKGELEGVLPLVKLDR
jgi:hypothetical protein